MIFTREYKYTILIMSPECALNILVVTGVVSQRKSVTLSVMSSHIVSVSINVPYNLFQFGRT